MNSKVNAEPQSKIVKRILNGLIVVGVLVVVMLFLFRPHIFIFYANVSSNQNVSGKVFRSPDGFFFVKLDSGSQLTVQESPTKVFLSSSSKTKGFCIGRFLILPASAIGGIDLSKSEGFGQQVPIIKNGIVTAKDPLKQNSSFSFPLTSSK
ncbi:MAG TPA: hypothetical protein VGH42_14320 [Verrucomicrobiae bacterium]|jgi:hypothetical protein